MKNHLLLGGALIALATLGANAETKTFTSDNLGEVTAVSANGEYASIYDTENNRSFLWTRSTGEFKEITLPEGPATQPAGDRVRGNWAMGVSNDGTVVGCILYYDGIQYPAIYKNGEWTRLPMHESAVNDNTAIAITGDNKYIGGYQFINDRSSDIKGRYYPCRWELQEDGSYKLQAYTDIDVLDHQGFYPTCMSPDGSILGGMLFAGVNSQIEAYVKDGKLFYDHKVEIKKEPWIFQGKYYCGTDADGKQIWTTDPNDPNIQYFSETYIDGVKDDGETYSFTGGFQGIDVYNNLYGFRTVASDVTAEGTGKLTSGAAILNSNDNTWKDYTEYQMFTNGLEGKYVFGPGDLLLVDGNPTTFTATFGFSSSRTISAFYKASLDGSVIGGCTYEVNPASGEPQFFPFIIDLGKKLIDNPGAVSEIETSEAVISITKGMISVRNAKSVAVYDLNGRMLSNVAETQVMPGVYVVRIDGKSHKVMVK